MSNMNLLKPLLLLATVSVLAARRAALPRCPRKIIDAARASTTSR